MAIAKGLIFYQERQFFYYPPQFSYLMNSPWFDLMIVAFGLVLVIYALIPYKNNALTGILLAVIASLIGLVTIIELEHYVFAGAIKLAQNIVSNLFIICVILWTARHHSKV
ncbi:hypothetical protein EFP68_01250 [Lactobacillus helveticus]|uniref:hypothetical protein n=1 Tax=Lactobacillus helveticus TaxID=1587 RepID=UPI001C1DED09|nr:hypothetical protein [Lactobacillus helveticus]MBU5980028.1 hypothetical protein [Lactobacillus helveticus]MCT3413371.1 hypothetical protein [Lactobacillus helveticus]